MNIFKFHLCLVIFYVWRTLFHSIHLFIIHLISHLFSFPIFNYQLLFTSLIKAILIILRYYVPTTWLPHMRHQLEQLIRECTTQHLPTKMLVRFAILCRLAITCHSLQLGSEANLTPLKGVIFCNNIYEQS